MERVARLAVLAFGDDMPSLKSLQKRAVYALLSKLSSLAGNDEAWSLLYSNELLTRMIIKAAAEKM